MKATVHTWRELYETDAEESDWVRAHRWGYFAEVASRTIADIREKLLLDSQHRLLEVSCDCGMVLSTLLQDNQTGLGVDSCHSLLAKARAFAVSLHNIELIAGEAARLPVADDAFDRVLCYCAIVFFNAFRRRNTPSVRCGSSFVCAGLAGLFWSAMYLASLSGVGLPGRTEDRASRRHARHWRFLGCYPRAGLWRRCAGVSLCGPGLVAGESVMRTTRCHVATTRTIFFGALAMSAAAKSSFCRRQFLDVRSRANALTSDS